MVVSLFLRKKTPIAQFAPKLVVGFCCCARCDVLLMSCKVMPSASLFFVVDVGCQ